MPSLLALLYCYFAFAALLVGVMLFGDAPWAAGTPLSFARWLMTEAWVAALEWAVDRAFGLAGLRALDAATEACCERSNPVLQITYLLIWSVGYALYWSHIFRLLPNQHAAGHHVFTGTAAVCITLLAFLAASASRPGAVTASNTALYLAAYPPDGLLFHPKTCDTCCLPRPGRSKHCSTCGGCIPRFDHHCGWINTCVGLHNLRMFLAFLAANLATCCYALGLGLVVMRGELQRRGLLDVYVYDPLLRQRVPLTARPARFAEWLLVFYPVQVGLGVFIAVGGLMLAAFLAYQVVLVSSGCTTYETFKRNTLHKEWRQQAAAAAAATAVKPGGSSGGGWRWLRRCGGAARPAVPLPPAAYNRGFAANWAEVLWPDRFLAACAQRAQAAGPRGRASGAAAGQGASVALTAERKRQ